MEDISAHTEVVMAQGVSATSISTGGDLSRPFRSTEMTIVEEGPKKNRKLLVLLGIYFVLVVVAVILGVTLSGNNKSDNPDSKDAAQEKDRDVVWPPENTIYPNHLLCFERIPLQGKSTLEDCQNTPTERGSGVMNLVAASRLWNFPSVDISIANAGEIRADVEAGNFTVADTRAMLPWNNTLVIVQIEGRALVTVLERALQRLVDNFLILEANETLSGGPYPYGAGIRYDVNMTNAFPNRITNVEVNRQPSTCRLCWMASH